MKTISKKILLSCLALIFSVPCFTQDFQGVAHYFSKTTVDMNNFGRREMSEEMKRQIAERMKSMFEKNYVLTFNKEESVYKEKEQLEAPGQGGRGFGRMMMSSFTGGPQYKNLKESLMLQEQEFFGKQFLVKDSLQKLDWKLEGETKKIGQYLCMKATAVKKVEGLDFSSLRPPRRDHEKQPDSLKNKESDFKMPAEIIVTAWYTPQIPVSHGPGEYWGLPGLILEVNAFRTTILCSKIVINPKNKTEIKKLEKGKEVTQQEYNQIVKNKTEEMSQMFRQRRPGEGRRQ